MRSLTKIFPINKQQRCLNIGMKISLYYLGLLIFSIAVCSFLYYKIYSSITAHKVSDISYQMLGSISANVNALVDHVNIYSKMIISDTGVRECLKKPQSSSNLLAQRSLNRYLINMVETMPLISAIYLFDNYGNRYGADKLTVKKHRIADLTKAEWYTAVCNAKGGYLLRLNAGDIFKENAPHENYVSFIRIINDLDTQNPIGTLIINISNQALQNSFSGVDQKYFTGLVLKDDRNRIVLGRNSPAFALNELLPEPGDKTYSAMTRKFQGKWYLFSETIINPLNWKIVSVMPFAELSRESQIFTIVAFAVILLNGVLLFFGFILISKLITVPIYKLLQSMKEVEKGQFNLADFKTGDDEIGRLKDGFNIMVREIRNLIERIVAEQKIIRQRELEVLQAQIKPHFLYNTFDAISSLALAGRSEDVYTIMKALGSYYRISLSKGSQIITIGEELETVKNYLTIQQIRYGDLFTAVYEVDESVLRARTLKLILQPLVENAIYHGIRPKGEKGTIIVSVKGCPDCIELKVADDGVGMEQTTMVAILSAEPTANRGSFGLRGTIERLRIFYGIENILLIDSEIGKGTTLTIRIPFEESC